MELMCRRIEQRLLPHNDELLIPPMRNKVFCHSQTQIFSTWANESKATSERMVLRDMFDANEE
jgi:hypothetical protein